MLPGQNFQGKEFLVNNRKKSWSSSRRSVCLHSLGFISLRSTPSSGWAVLVFTLTPTHLPSTEGACRRAEDTSATTQTHRAVQGLQPGQKPTPYSLRCAAAEGTRHGHRVCSVPAAAPGLHPVTVKHPRTEQL